MKIDFILVIISITIAVLIALGLYNLHDGKFKLLLSIGSILNFSFSLILALGIKFNESRTNINIKFISGVFFLIGLCINIFFTFIKFSVSTYVIVNGLLLSVFILSTYLISKERQ